MRFLSDHGRYGLGRTVILFSLISSLPARHADSQMTPEGGELLAFFASEQQRGSLLTYTQSYTDDRKERVSYGGTLYAGTRVFKLDECQMMARVAVEDRYSGTIGHRSFGGLHFEQTGQLTDDTVYEYHVNLGELSPDGVHAIRAVPADLDINTTFRCQEDRSCNLDWIQITSPVQNMGETRTVNDFQNLDLKVNSIALPMSSQEFAVQGAKLFGALVRACSTRNAVHE
jgi:hypothetical protein